MVRRAHWLLAGLIRALGRTVLVWPLAAAPSLSAAVVPGCGCGGGTEAALGLAVTVVDESSGGHLCDATVTARDADHAEVLVPFRTAQDCYYVGAAERPGTYTIEVVHGDRTATVQGVRVNSGGCHVIGTSIDATLPTAAAVSANAEAADHFVHALHAAETLQIPPAERTRLEGRVAALAASAAPQP